MILDVGCGNSPKGDVNTDLFLIDSFNHRNNDTAINPKEVKNFILCDARYLPFKNSIFDKVISRSVIEHIKNPSLMFSELVRVSRLLIIIETSHFRSERFKKIHFLNPKKTIIWHRQHHINFFSFDSLNQAIKLYDCKLIRNYVTSYIFFPNEYFTLIKIPCEIGVEFEKQHNG